MGSIVVAVGPDYWTLAAAAICAAISARIVAWRPQPGQQYKLGQSLLAWFMAASTGGYALQVGLSPFFFRPAPETSPMLVAILLVVMAQVYRARGNVAAFLRVHWG
ncbi:phage holin family protein [Ectopseudomonas mendocina]|uniref:Phage holin family protein n=1 Tax=Ectopseudomonas mendocina TaxID=300 RepID=A0ABD7S0P5_ECTME|nr:phage holin family protein [Pseudomonas mendocina]TRO14353.1 phage holin family protein [Pseudomonas mendocina]TRO19404.1 phage holin family protein [Pseudomonas mendocina]